MSIPHYSHLYASFDKYTLHYLFDIKRYLNKKCQLFLISYAHVKKYTKGKAKKNVDNRADFRRTHYTGSSPATGRFPDPDLEHISQARVQPFNPPFHKSTFPLELAAGLSYHQCFVCID
jgi:hypothetical protein